MEASHHHTSTGVDSRKMGMWIIIGSECMLFGTLIINYIVQSVRNIFTEGVGIIRPLHIINVPITSISTFALLMSSVGMVFCLKGAQDGKVKNFRFWCFTTAALGAIFLGFQIYEFSVFYLEGMSLQTNNFGSAFFALTGTHGLHVLVGIVILCSAGLWSYKNTLVPDKHAPVVETLGLYWHFVDVIWIIIFTIVYLFVLAPNLHGFQT